jgi:hypothetical protein
MFASSSRLDLGITVGLKKPGHIKAILSGPLPIFVDCGDIDEEIGGSALWRMRAALKHRVVREIAFTGTGGNFDKIFKETKYAFPELENLYLDLGYDGQKVLDTKLLDSFLGPDPSNPRLRRLGLYGFSLASVFRFLSPATSLTEIFLRIRTAFNPSSERFLLESLQGMTCLRRLDLDLSILSDHQSLESSPQHSASKVVQLSKLSDFYYVGHPIFLDAFVAGVSAPSLRDFWIQFFDFDDTIWPPTVDLTRFINEMQERYHTAHVGFDSFKECVFRLSLLTQSEYMSHCQPRFMLDICSFSPESIIGITGTLAMSLMLTTVDELYITFNTAPVDLSEDYILWRRFYRHFPSVKALRTKGAYNINCVARALCPDDGKPVDLALFPALEEIDLGKRSSIYMSKSLCRALLLSFQRFISARQQAGRPVKVFFSS